MALAAILLNLEPVGPVPPTPTPAPAPPPGSGGLPWADRQLDPVHPFDDVEDYAREAERVLIDCQEQPGVKVCLYATMLSVAVIERGNMLTFVATFTGDPGEVNFSYVKPGEKRPRVDPGFGAEGSQIVLLSYDRQSGVSEYAVTLDTTGMRGGALQWHFYGTGKDAASAFGEVRIRERPAGLL